jgi:hypothetical protein
MKKLFLIFSILIIFSGCKLFEKPPVKQIQSVNTSIIQSINTKESIKLILERILIDSASLKMVFRCDSNNQVIMESLNITSGELIYFKTMFKNGVLNLRAFTDSIKFYRTEITRLRDSISISKKDTSSIKIIPENYLTSYQKLAVKSFSWALIFILLLLISFIIYWFKFRRK